MGKTGQDRCHILAGLYVALRPVQLGYEILQNHHGEVYGQHISTLGSLPGHHNRLIDRPEKVTVDKTSWDSKDPPEHAWQVRPPGVW